MATVAPTAASVLTGYVAVAWSEYLETTAKARREASYEEVEPWAWKRLKARLEQLQIAGKERTRD